MLIQDISSVDLSKYKRLFVFGCSFTNYKWPTWANMLHREMPDAEFFNFGRAGAGNTFIAAMLIEVNERYQFTETDLVIAQWSTYFREDRYVANDWLTPGNIFTQDTYDADFVKKFACPRGYLIRDMATITSIKYMLKSLPSDGIMLSSILAQGEDATSDISDITTLYEDTISSMHTPMAEILRPPGDSTPFPWPATIKYTVRGKIVHDYHPGPLSYHLYLQKLNFNLTNESLVYAGWTDNIISHLTAISEFECHWPNWYTNDKRL